MISYLCLELYRKVVFIRVNYFSFFPCFFRYKVLSFKLLHRFHEKTKKLLDFEKKKKFQTRSKVRHFFGQFVRCNLNF